MTNFTNNFDLNKAHHDSFFKKASENDIEKAAKGEGSKGGKVIGHTKSGKPIYDKYNHSTHKDFTKQDHMDASNIHDMESLEGKKHSQKGQILRIKEKNDSKKKDLEASKSTYKQTLDLKEIEKRIDDKFGIDEGDKSIHVKDLHEIVQNDKDLDPNNATQNLAKVLSDGGWLIIKSEDNDSLQKAFEVLGLK